MMSMDIVMSSATSTIEFFAQFPVEILFTGALWFVLAVYAFSAGNSRLNSIAIALVLAGLLFMQVPAAWPFSDGVSETISPWASSPFIFFVLALLLYGAIRRMTGETFDDTGGIVTAVLAGLAVVAVILALWSHVPQLSALHPFPAPLLPYFSAQFFFWWLFGPLVALAALTQTRFW